MRIHHPLRTPLTACLCLSGLALAAGCAVAPAGATTDSPAIGLVRTGAGAKNFPPFPMPTVWNGADGVVYQTVDKAKTGTAPRKFGITAKSSMVFWLNCIGTGTAQLAGPAIGLKWSVRCGDGTSPSGLTFRPPRAVQGKSVKVLATVSAGSRWEVRIDAPQPKKAS